MSPKKIDPKQVVESIFGPARGAEPRGARHAVPLEAEDDVTKLAGKSDRKASSKRKGLHLPAFLRRGKVHEFGAVDVGHDSIKFVLLVYDGRRLSLQDVQVESVAPVALQESEVEREREIMNGLVKIASRLKPKTKVGIAINDPALYMDLLTVPAATEDEYREFVRRALAEKRFIDPETSFFDYAIMRSTSGGTTQELFVVACPKELVYRQFEMVQSAGFKVLSVETNGLATLQALRRIARWSTPERVLILDIGSRLTDLTVVIGDRIVFNRIIPIAGERFTKAVSETLGCDVDQAERLKVKYGLTMRRLSEPPHPVGSIGGEEEKEPREDASLRAMRPIEPAAAMPGEPPQGDGASEGERVSGALRNEVNKLVGEVERSFEFAFAKEAHTESAPIHHIFVFGGGARMASLREYLGERWGVPVRDVNLWEGLGVDERRIDREFLAEANDLASVSIGLALRVQE